MYRDIHLIKISSIIAQIRFDSFGLKLSLIVILTNFSHSSNSSKLLACENLQFYSMCQSRVYVLVYFVFNEDFCD